MKYELKSTLFKTIPVLTIAFLLSCSETSKEVESKVNDNAKVLVTSKESADELKNEVIEVVNEKLIEITEEVLPEEVEDNKNEEENSLLPSDHLAGKITTEVKKEVIESLPLKINHESWNKLLSKNVTSSGKVNYKGFKANKTELDNYLQLLKSNAPTSDWSKNEKLAYWINVYNAFTVKLIVDNYPLKSITDLDKPWDKKWIDIDGKSYSLGNVENDILRKMGESRIHFAINCASFSCPNLLNTAFTADKLSSQLRKVTKDFFEDGTKNDLTDGDLKISKLFEWYAADFSNGDIVAYINKYSGKTVSNDSKISYLEYSWKLNE